MQAIDGSKWSFSDQSGMWLSHTAVSCQRIAIMQHQCAILLPVSEFEKEIGDAGMQGTVCPPVFAYY